jgi:hypothetical protein
MIIWFGIITVLLLFISIIGISWGDDDDKGGFIAVPLITWTFIALLPSLVGTSHSIDIDKNTEPPIEYLVNVLPHSRYIIVPIENNSGVSTVQYFSYNVSSEIAKIDSVDFYFQKTVNYNMWGSILDTTISLKFNK